MASKNIVHTYLLSTARESSCTCARCEENIPHQIRVFLPTKEDNVQSLENFVSQKSVDDSRTRSPYSIDFENSRSLRGSRVNAESTARGYFQFPGREDRADRGIAMSKQRAGEERGRVNREAISERKNREGQRKDRASISSRADIPKRNARKERKIERSVTPTTGGGVVGCRRDARCARCQCAERRSECGRRERERANSAVVVDMAADYDE